MYTCTIEHRTPIIYKENRTNETNRQILRNFCCWIIYAIVLLSHTESVHNEGDELSRQPDDQNCIKEKRKANKTSATESISFSFSRRKTGLVVKMLFGHWVGESGASWQEGKFAIPNLEELCERENCVLY
ncbi:hypothetical protein OUZ56_016003 [Daphnia magna]|uniref:Uncharacterized protein n=1 Tax=Daphnia magna TaxID=35525 RepID=A0ABR0APD8_9CRUS|nr:hypothetical protein OUZ56_016003 [Daphnia magna]